MIEQTQEVKDDSDLVNKLSLLIDDIEYIIEKAIGFGPYVWDALDEAREVLVQEQNKIAGRLIRNLHRQQLKKQGESIEG